MKLDHLTKDQLFGKTKVEILYEMLMWDKDAHENDLNKMAKKVVELGGNYKLPLLLICYCQSNIGASFNEKWYLFDEDKIEMYRQLRIGTITHIFTFGIIFFLAYNFQILVKSIPHIGLWLGVIMIVGYLYITIKNALSLFNISNNRINRVKLNEL